MKVQDTAIFGEANETTFLQITKIELMKLMKQGNKKNRSK
jgi:hypothetical protein